MKSPKRGDIYLVNLDPVMGSEQGKTRPVVIIQNNIFNEHGNVVIVASLSGRAYRGYLSDVFIPEGSVSGIAKASIVVGNQIRTIDKQRLIRWMGKLPEELMRKVDEALRVSLALVEY